MNNKEREILKLSPKIKKYLKNLLTEDLYKKYQIQLEKLCKRLELQCFIATYENHISGSIIKNKDTAGYSIYVNKKHPRDRQRFTVAHEIGHYISYLNGSFSKSELERRGGFEDKSISYVKRGKLPLAQIEANLIAQEILMPKKMVDDLVEEGLTPEEMANIFFISPCALTIRLLGLYPNLIIV